ncbi:hypothetical protein MPL1_11868 [Methylophaga lonarensis MPL]|uniref:Uncharacterized protein n=1 Tax=Methylophaga lonarensis MPL TaxID=1286106 RepID=M7NY15_9GAMM|nr:hypothetical protein [Methylophaga lonarensis]EMR12142.1 hypothetical protein MPL1_11868 [Methylophaga lonarensis MPL]
MAKSARPSPSLMPAVLALLVVFGIGYLLYSDLRPTSRTEHLVHPPIEIIEPDLPLTIIEPPQPAIEHSERVIQDAQRFVENLVMEDSEENVVVTEEQDAFARLDSTISVPDQEKRQTTVEALISDKTLDANTPLTLEYTEQIEQKTTLSALEKSRDEKISEVTIVTEQGQSLTAPLFQLLEREDLDPDAPITLIEQRQQTREITAGELAGSGIKADQDVTATINRGMRQFALRDIIPDSDIPDNTLYYLHRVTEQDRLGLWGIIQSGLIEQFRKGLRIEGVGYSRDLIRVTIPADADQPLPSGLSSFLGRVLFDKVKTSYIYNFNTQTMGQNPNLIYPGQELIVIQFSQDELRDIYLFFAEQRRERAESFAISH